MVSLLVKRVCVLCGLMAVLFGSIPAAGAEPLRRGDVMVPDTSIPRAGDFGLRAHTNHVLRVGPKATGLAPAGETPASIRQVYALPSGGGSGVIAVVGAFHYPTALSDFNVFSDRFGLPRETSTSATSKTNQVFQMVYATGRKPRSNAGWAQEAALDTQWAHAMAPGAKIVLVEAASNTYADLMKAVDVASKLPNVKQISMSWGGREFSSEATYDSHFQAPGVVYFAASGDTGGQTCYPGVSPYVVSAGGTRINRDSSGNFTGETGWSGSGGGTSAFEPRPSYQLSLASVVGDRRGVPDLSFDADPATGVSVYDSTPYLNMSGWLVFGGTSVASPSLAGIVNCAGSGAAGFESSTAAELTNRIYANLGNPAVFRDILTGTAGSFSCQPGWDMVTGVGSCMGLDGK